MGESGVEKGSIKVADITTLYKILEGTYSEADGIFTPALTYKGAETRTVALLEETLSDGTPIRFPRLKNVLTDQRGVSRLEKTCMGAYEIGCGSDTTFSTDTINVGTKIYGQTFTKVGVHDSIFETLKDARGCDSVVMYRVVVKPDPTTFNYYVKMDKEGRGDGSDWDNAMDSTDFATYLPLAPDGATFYVAAGTYKPIYDATLIKNSNTRLLCYTVNSDITIKGGYSSKSTGTNVVSEPDKYHTIFDGDIDGDDEIDETLDEEGYPVLTRTNGDENIEYLFNVGNYGNTNVNNFTLEGVVCQNSIYYALYSTGASLNLYDVTIKNNSGPAVYGFEDVDIRKSVLSKNNTYNVINIKGDNISIVNTTIENNRTSSQFIYISSKEDVYVNFDSVSYLNNRILNILDKSNCDVSVSNSHFSGNYAYSSSYFASVKQVKSHDNVFEKNRGIYGIYNTSLGSITLKNDKFDSNSTDFIANSNETLNVNNSTFSGNTLTGANCIVSGNNVVVVDSKFNDNVRNSESAISAIYANGTCEAIRDTIENNSMGGLFRTKELKLDSCIVRNNNSQIVYFDNTNGYTRLNECDSIVNSTFEGNIGAHAAGRDSSLFVIHSANLVVNKNTFIDNRSGLDMMRLWGGDNVTISECLFSENKVYNLLDVQKSNNDNFTFEENTLSGNVLSGMLLSEIIQ